MQNKFFPDAAAVFMGSLPLNSHEEGLRFIFEKTSEIPVWVELPVFPQERMIPKFAPGLPGLVNKDDKLFVDTSEPGFEQGILEFYEEFMAVEDGTTPLENSRFILDERVAKGLALLADELATGKYAPVAVKGQITGPFTFCTGMRDENDSAIFYNEQLRDAAVKLLTLKAVWQIRRLSAENRPVIIFCDEPALAGYGTSQFISVSREEVVAALAEPVDAIHREGGIAGVHVCANTDWSLALDSSFDIVSFDAYSYFDRFILYPDLIKKFMGAGKILAWGIVPTGDPEIIEKETADSLFRQLNEKIDAVEKLGVDRKTIIRQSLITPSCGAGSLSPEHSEKVADITVEISKRVRDAM